MALWVWSASATNEGAGLRTHALVGLGSALFRMASAFGFGDVLGPPHITLDPSRIAAQVVTGVSFLGAGTIIFQREMIRGLTTAARSWAVAAIGFGVGGGLYGMAACATGLTLGVLAGLKPLEHHLFSQRRSRFVTLWASPGAVSLDAIERAIESVGMHLEQVPVQPGGAAEDDRIDLVIDSLGAKNLCACGRFAPGKWSGSDQFDGCRRTQTNRPSSILIRRTAGPQNSYFLRSAAQDPYQCSGI